MYIPLDIDTSTTIYSTEPIIMQFFNGVRVNTLTKRGRKEYQNNY